MDTSTIDVKGTSPAQTCAPVGYLTGLSLSYIRVYEWVKIMVGIGMREEGLAALILELQLAKGQFVHLIDELTDTLGGLDERLMREGACAESLLEPSLLSL